MKRIDELKAERSEVEDIFKLGKCGLLMDKIHRFKRFVAKFVYANVLLIASSYGLDLRRGRTYRGLLSGEFGDTLYSFFHLAWKDGDCILWIPEQLFFLNPARLYSLYFLVYSIYD